MTHRHRERLKQKSRDRYALTRNGKEKQKAKSQISPELATPTTSYVSTSMSSGGDDDSESAYSPSGELMTFWIVVFILTMITHHKIIIPDEDVTSDDASNIDLNKTDELSDDLHSEHYDPYLGYNIADRAFLEDYHSAYWQPAMSLGIGRRLGFVRDKVGLWLGKWGGLSGWGWGLPRNQLERHQEAGLALLFQLTCAVSDSRGVGTISQDELRQTLLAAIQITEPLGRGLGLLEYLLRDSPVPATSSG